MFKTVFITILISLCTIYSFTISNFPHSSTTHLLAGNDKYREKVISPDDIASLFGSGFSYNDNIDEVDDDEDDTNLISEKEDVVADKKGEGKLLSVRNSIEPKESQKNSIEDDYLESKEMNMDYMNLDRVLDRDTRLGVLDLLSMDASDESLEDPRQVSYDPQSSARYRFDRMNYGTYRRWKLAEIEVKEKAAAKKKGKGKDKTGFFDSIKKLGSGPAPRGASTGVGVAEPPPNMKNITPKRPPSRKPAGKKVITPDEINSLFKQPDTKTEESSASPDEVPSSGGKGFFGFMAGADDEIPDWILQAEREEKKKKALKGRKPKKLTDDWRFWAACVAGAGFVSAFVNIYQQTGGFGANNQELMI